MTELIVLFLVSLGLGTIFLEIVRNLFEKKKILDNPKKYGKTRAPVPYGVGIVFFISFFILSFLFIEYNYKLGLIWFFGSIVTVVSFFDDRYRMSPKIRLLIQILIGATIGITSIKIGYVSNIFGGVVELETFSFYMLSREIFIIPLIFTIAWYVFVFNALNWSDGIGGNTSGLSGICFLVIFLLGLKLYMTDDHSALRDNTYFIMQMALVLVAILIPFFYLDYKEKLLMGDAGSMFLGFMLATLAIISGGKIATVLAVFGIYAVDALYVIVRRVMKGKNPMTGDFTHLHHRLLAIGFSKDQVLVLVFGLSFFFGVASLFLDREGKVMVFCIIAIFVVCLSYVGERVKKISFKK